MAFVGFRSSSGEGAVKAFGLMGTVALLEYGNRGIGL
jgi:hypothetical protein